MSFLPVYLERESSEISKKIKDTIRSAYQKGYNDGWNELLKRADATPPHMYYHVVEYGSECFIHVNCMRLSDEN